MGTGTILSPFVPQGVALFMTSLHLGTLPFRLSNRGDGKTVPAMALKAGWVMRWKLRAKRRGLSHSLLHVVHDDIDDFSDRVVARFERDALQGIAVVFP